MALKRGQVLQEQFYLFYFGRAKRTNVYSCRGAIAIVCIFFLIIAKKEFGLTDTFKKDNQKKE